MIEEWGEALGQASISIALLKFFWWCVESTFIYKPMEKGLNKDLILHWSSLYENKASGMPIIVETVG